MIAETMAAVPAMMAAAIDFVIISSPFVWDVKPRSIVVDLTAKDETENESAHNNTSFRADHARVQ